MTDQPGDPAIATEAAALPLPTPIPQAEPLVLTRPVVTLDTSAAKGLLMSVATGTARVAGTFLMAHGAMSSATAATIEPIIAQEIAGTALLVAGQAWAMLREWLSHQKRWALALTDPSNILVK